MSKRLPDVVFSRPIESGLELKCRQCNAVTVVALPVNVTDLAAFTKAFIQLHKPCARLAGMGLL